MGQNTVSSPFWRRKSDAHFTRIKRDDGWKHLEELRGQFYGQMYKINPEIISRFLIKSTPTIISVEGTYFKVQQFAQADVRGIRV